MSGSKVRGAPREAVRTILQELERSGHTGQLHVRFARTTWQLDCVGGRLVWMHDDATPTLLRSFLQSELALDTRTTLGVSAETAVTKQAFVTALAQRALHSDARIQEAARRAMRSFIQQRIEPIGAPVSYELVPDAISVDPRLTVAPSELLEALEPATRPNPRASPLARGENSLAEPEDRGERRRPRRETGARPSAPAVEVASPVSEAPAPQAVEAWVAAREARRAARARAQASSLEHAFQQRRGGREERREEAREEARESGRGPSRASRRVSSLESNLETRGEQGRGKGHEQGREQERGRDREQERRRDRGRDREQDRGKDRERDRGKDRAKDREQDRGKDREKDREQDRERDRGKDREKDRE
ncbi:MAG: hypothetical protein KC468_21875, partial [Myxococcales bacterium]|nr:hypothetical protein [Myxococcales bacterium]